MWRLLDRYFGRGAYPSLRAVLAPERVHVQDFYPRLVLEALRSHRRWLDAGCGHDLFEGRFTAMEREARDRASLVIGCDAALSSLRKHRSIRRLAASELDRLPFRNASFDLVTLHWVVEHLEDPARVFREIARVLAPGGLVILRTPNSASYYVALARIGVRLIPDRLADALVRYMQHREPDEVFPTFYKANTRRDLSATAARVGLVAERIILFADQPLFYFVAPFAVVELLLARVATRWLGLQSLCADSLVAVLRQPHATDLHAVPVPGRRPVSAMIQEVLP